MVTGNWNTDGRRTVVGYFSNAEDAHLAIQDLVAAGFRSSSMGAAFPTANPVVDTDLHPAVGPNAGTGTSATGPASGSGAVNAAGLSAGSGTVFSGASRPGPITGSEIPAEIPSVLPHSIPSTLPSSLHPSASAAIPVATDVYPATGVTSSKPKASGLSWSERLKHVFTSNNEDLPRETTASVDKTSQNFGTGEGHLGVYPDYAYSDAAFESAFFGMGVDPAYARHLSGRLRSGGAAVTVETSTAVEADQAEQILERNGGSARMETLSGIPASASSQEMERRMELFGRVRSVYPGYVSSGMPTRKAS